MADIDVTGSGPLLGTPNWDGQGKVYVLAATIDLTGDVLVENDVYQCLAVPADTLVMNVKVEILTPAVGTTLTMDVGDGGGVDSWDANVDGKAVAGTFTHSVVGTDAYAAAAAQGKFYDAADSIDIVMDVATSITAGPKFRISALCVDYN